MDEIQDKYIGTEPIIEPPPDNLEDVVPITPRRTRKSRTTRTTERKPLPKVVPLETQIGALLTSLNLFIALSPWRKDALDPAEVAALAKAIDQQAKASPRFRKYVEVAVSAGSGGQLLGVIIMIGVRRAARHGYLEESFDAMIGAMFVQETGVPSTPFEIPFSDEPQKK
jgi:hypothetical protein